MWTRFVGMMVLLMLVVACGGETAVLEPPVTAEAEVAPPADSAFVPLTAAEVTTDMQVILASSELVVGENRFAVGLLNADNEMLHEADVFLRFFDVSDPNAPQLEGEVVATAVSAPDGSVTLYTVSRQFAQAGNWGVEVQARFPDQTAGLQRVSFSVAEGSKALLPGAAAPKVETPTLASRDDDLTLLSTAETPNPAFYELSLAAALANDKPTLLYLGTPAFCSSRVCGPGYDIYNQLFAEWGDKVNFVQVEIFDDLPDPAASGWPLTEVMVAFGLTTEPWLYFIDSEGMIQYRIEGLFGVEEVAQRLAVLH